MESVTSLGIILTCLGALSLTALAARNALPSFLNQDEIPVELRPRIDFIDRNRKQLTAAGTAFLLLGPLLSLLTVG